MDLPQITEIPRYLPADFLQDTAATVTLFHSWCHPLLHGSNCEVPGSIGYCYSGPLAPHRPLSILLQQSLGREQFSCPHPWGIPLLGCKYHRLGSSVFEDLTETLGWSNFLWLMQTTSPSHPSPPLKGSHLTWDWALNTPELRTFVCQWQKSTELIDTKMEICHTVFNFFIDGLIEPEGRDTVGPQE